MFQQCARELRWRSAGILGLLGEGAGRGQQEDSIWECVPRPGRAHTAAAVERQGRELQGYGARWFQSLRSLVRFALGYNGKLWVS